MLNGEVGYVGNLPALALRWDDRATRRDRRMADRGKLIPKSRGLGREPLHENARETTLERQRRRPPRRLLTPSGGPAPRRARRLFRLPWPSKPLIWLRDTLRCRNASRSQPHARRLQPRAPRLQGLASLPRRRRLRVQRRPPLHQLALRLPQLRLSLHQRSPRHPSSQVALLRRNHATR